MQKVGRFDMQIILGASGGRTQGDMQILSGASGGRTQGEGLLPGAGQIHPGAGHHEPSPPLCQG